MTKLIGVLLLVPALGAMATCGAAPDAGTCLKSTELIPDVDHDGYGSMNASPEWGCLKAGEPRAVPPDGFALNKQDCADTDARAHPGQTVWQTVPMGQPGAATSGLLWDFNCDGRETPEHPGPANACPTNATCAGTPTGGGFWLGAVPSCGQIGTWASGCEVVGSQCVPMAGPRIQGCL